MDLELKPGAIKDMKELSDQARKDIIKVLEEFEEKQFTHPGIKQIKDNDGKWIWRLKVKTDYTDHRVFIDYIDGCFQVLEVMHRDNAYE